MVDQRGKDKEEDGNQQPTAEQDQFALFDTGFAVDTFPRCTDFALWRIGKNFSRRGFSWKHRPLTGRFWRRSFKGLLYLYGGDSRSVLLIAIHGVSSVSGLVSTVLRRRWAA